MASFRKRLVLHRWLVDQVAAPVWDRGGECNRRLKAAEAEPWGEESPFLKVLIEERNPSEGGLSDGVLVRLDADIVAITRTLGVQRWLYFQYLAMLFSGLYLDAYFANRHKLLAALNERVQEFNAALPPVAEGRRGRGARARDDGPLPLYTIEDLARLACWQATGSGKTLLLHANRLQALLYSRQYEGENRANQDNAAELLPPERTMLIAPNRMLVGHHVEEGRALGVSVTAFDAAIPITRHAGRKDGNVLAASISQFQPPGEKHTVGKVPPDYFPGRNLVLVDEGHRGTAADSQWRAIREALAGIERDPETGGLSRGTPGFLIEYSATLEQAAKDHLRDYYARCIYIDYSYPKFYKDGYGKHHRILNLVESRREQERDYFVAAMVAFFQQLDVFEHSEAAMRAANIERPLLLFAGRTVTGETKKYEDKAEKVEEADIKRLMRFFAEFVSGFDGVRPMLEDVVAGHPGFQTKRDEDVFATWFPEVVERDAAKLYAAMLARVFRASSPGNLCLEILKDAPGEVGVRVGDHDFFAVINVGKPAELTEQLAKADDRIKAKPNEFRGSLFGGLKERDNRLTMLIGSKKFAEGWSSWRVSQIGLLHIGKGEGTQVIQLFGRGVRLKGKGGSLKRSSPTWKEDLTRGSELSRLRVLETLNVFAVDAKYLKRFQEQIDEIEKDDEEDEREEMPLPVIRDQRAEGVKLRVPVPPHDREFRRGVSLSADPGVAPPAEIAPSARHLHAVHDLTPRVQTAGDAGITVPGQRDKASLDLVRAFADHDSLYEALVELKNREGWTNLALPRTVKQGSAAVPLTEAILTQDDLFSLYLPERYVKPGAVPDLRHLNLWDEIGRRLVSGYVQRLYKHCIGRWRTLNAKMQELDSLDAEALAAMYPPGWPDAPKYDVSYVSDSAPFVQWLGEVSDKVKAASERTPPMFLKDDFPGALTALSGTRSLYHPLLYRPAKARVDVRVRPVALNAGEGLFVERLHKWLASSAGAAAVGDAEVYLLRNFSKSGLGFFVGRGFYPDFIIWVTRGAEQWVSFVDPKGLLHLAGDTDGKVTLAQDLREVETRAGGGTTHLDSWIWSVTRKSEALNAGFSQDFLKNHIVFDEDGEAAMAKVFARASNGGAA